MFWQRWTVVAVGGIAALLLLPAPARLQAQPAGPCGAAIGVAGSAALRAPQRRDTKRGRFGADSRDIRDLLHLESVASKARSRAASTAARPAADRDDNHIAILEDEGAPDRTVFHCFSGDAKLVKICADNGWYMSFAGNVTFRNAPDLREAAAAAPLDLIVTETDSPYLSPHPHRGKPNEPARVVLTTGALAELHGISDEEMAVATTANARRLFNLPS